LESNNGIGSLFKQWSMAYSKDAKGSEAQVGSLRIRISRNAIDAIRPITYVKC